VDLVPQFFSVPRVALQRIQSAERLDCGDSFACLHDGTHDRMNGARTALEERLQNTRALGNPRATVQELRSLEEPRHVDLHRGSANCLQASHGGRKAAAVLRREIAQFGDSRDAHPESRSDRRNLARRGPRKRVLAIEVREYCVDPCRVGGVRRECSDAIEASARRHEAARTPAPARWLEAYEI